jgi:hypothetical protein
MVPPVGDITVVIRQGHQPVGGRRELFRGEPVRDVGQILLGRGPGTGIDRGR